MPAKGLETQTSAWSRREDHMVAESCPPPLLPSLQLPLVNIYLFPRLAPGGGGVGCNLFYSQILFADSSPHLHWFHLDFVLKILQTGCLQLPDVWPQVSALPPAPVTSAPGATTSPWALRVEAGAARASALRAFSPFQWEHEKFVCLSLIAWISFYWSTLGFLWLRDVNSDMRYLHFSISLHHLLGGVDCDSNF